MGCGLRVTQPGVDIESDGCLCRVNAACAPRLDMTLADFADWWRMHKAGQDARLLYLKDWHFANEFPHYKAYDTPLYFQQDWLNEYFDMKQTLKKARCSKGSMTAQPASGDHCTCVSVAELETTEDGPSGTGSCIGTLATHSPACCRTLLLLMSS